MTEPGEGGPGRCLVVSAAAKINLFLHIVGRRDDGMHELQSLFAFADVSDEIQIGSGNNLTLEISGPFAAALRRACPEPDDNIVLKATRRYAAQLGLPKLNLSIHLDKKLPVEAGIGGGSADAAATLRGLSNFLDRSIESDDVEEIAESLGADVPACLNALPKFVEGIGERITPVRTFESLPVLLANPGKGISTAGVYAGYKDSQIEFTEAIDFAALPPLDRRVLINLIEGTRNDLEPAATAICPEISTVLQELGSMRGVISARMSGSGATCFAIFDQETESVDAAKALRHRHPNWWVQATRLIGAEPAGRGGQK